MHRETLKHAQTRASVSSQKTPARRRGRAKRQWVVARSCFYCGHIWATVPARHGEEARNCQICQRAANNLRMLRDLTADQTDGLLDALVELERMGIRKNP